MDRRRIFSRTLTMMFTVLVFVFMFYSNTLTTTTSRFVKQEKDEIYARYTALYFETSIKKAAIAYENGSAYVSFDVYNYEDTWVTQRDIEYKVRIEEVQYYDGAGNTVTDAYNGELFAKDVWGNLVKVGNDTLKYSSEIVEYSGETIENGGKINNLFTYEELGATGVSKTHSLTVKLTRDEKLQTLPGDEHVSIVIELVRPYREIYVIDLTISNKIITFSNNTFNKFETDLEVLNCQTVNIFSHYYNGNNRVTISDVASLNNKKYLSNAVMLEIVFDGLYLDENLLERIHIPSDGTGSSNIDISQPYVIPQNGDIVTYSGNTGTLRIYVPQASDFSLYFLPIADNYSIKVNIQVMLETGYTLYHTNIGGYEHTNSYYTIMTGSKAGS